MSFLNSFDMGLAGVEQETAHTPPKHGPGRRRAVSQGYRLLNQLLQANIDMDSFDERLQLHIANGDDPFAIEPDVPVQGKKEQIGPCLVAHPARCLVRPSPANRPTRSVSGAANQSRRSG